MYAEAEQKGVARMDARLTILTGRSSGRIMPIPAGKLIIGREQDCQLRSMSEFVSRHHCVLLHDEYSLRIRDLGSTNGTFVNKRRITNGETVLLHGDIVSIGDLAFEIMFEPATLATPRAVLDTSLAALAELEVLRQ
jgi:pSer/pThr/pTyr-binding forkhead associated (FHA) protein